MSKDNENNSLKIELIKTKETLSSIELILASKAKKIAELKKEIKKLKEKEEKEEKIIPPLKNSDIELKELKDQLAHRDIIIKNLLSSTTFKLGKIFTSPTKKIIKLFKMGKDFLKKYLFIP